MRRAVLAVAAAVALAVVAGAARTPLFVQWLRPSDPGDETIRVYWEKAQAGGASPRDLMDLGTMLFRRGFPEDAEHFYKSAAEALADQPERGLEGEVLRAEAWFRIGLVEHSRGDVREARRSYHRCLKILTGHGWCNFYLARLEEETGHPASALRYYQRAFRFAPELADPSVNPEVLYSNLDTGALAALGKRRRFAEALPMGYLDPGGMAAVMQRFLPTPTPTPTPNPTVAPEAAPTPSPQARPQPVRRKAAPAVKRRTPRGERIQRGTPGEGPAAAEGSGERQVKPNIPEDLRERIRRMRELRKMHQMQGVGRRPGETPAPAAPTPTPGGD